MLQEFYVALRFRITSTRGSALHEQSEHCRLDCILDLPHNASSRVLHIANDGSREAQRSRIAHQQVLIHELVSSLV